MSWDQLPMLTLLNQEALIGDSERFQMDVCLPKITKNLSFALETN